MTSQVVPGCAVPWPHPKRWSVTRRLLALWRWEHERGPDSDAANNARRSLRDRTSAIVDEETWVT
jgi:hypothetical protein